MGNRLDAEAGLVDRAKHDPDAFAELYERYCDRIYRFAYRRLNVRADAEDLTAEVFMKALRGIKAYKNTGRPFGAWLYRIEANALAERYRRQRSMAPLDDMLDVPDWCRDVLEEVLRKDRIRWIWAAADELPSRQRTAIVLRFAADLPLRTIGEVMEKSEGAVKLLIYRGIGRLREQLARSEDRGDAGV